MYSTLLGQSLSAKTEARRAYWMLSLPAILFYFGVMTFPSLFSVFLSLTNYSGGSLFEEGALKFVGLKNYIKVFSDQYFYVSLKNNLWIVLVSVFGQLPLGFFLAYILTRGLVRAKNFFQTMIYLPCVISTVVIGILFQTFFSSSGAWTEIMKWINPSYEWTMGSSPMLPVLFVILWMYTGTYLIIFLANLQKIDPQIIEAATIDGASERQVLWHVIFPELSGVFVISAILAISGSLKSFDLIYVMTAGGPAKQTYVLSLYMFDKAFKGAADYPMANTISTIMVVISLILIGVVKTLEKKFGAKEE
ncbi:MAG: sugar ABC transporter permease [Treponema sp.]|nr:sugar ABC transporter permease [Treponema sp.]